MLKNEIQLSNPLDSNLRPLKDANGELSAIEVANLGNGVRISGDLEITGDAYVGSIHGFNDGMILGYRDVGLNEAEASYNLTTSYVVPTDEFGVTFTAPPSGNVEIHIQVGVDNGGSGAGDFFAGLSTANNTDGYSALASYHEKEVVDQGVRNGYAVAQLSWTLTGLTSGTSYTYYAGFKSSSTTGTPHIQWGGNSSGGSPDFIMKAIALPSSIET